MIRRLLKLLTALSLLLCVAVVVLWVRSYRVRDDIELQTVDHRHRSFTTYYFDLSGGSVFASRSRVACLDEEQFAGTLAHSELGWQRATRPASSNTGKRMAARALGPGERRWAGFGLGYIQHRLGPPAYRIDTRSDSLWIPMWMLVALLSVPPACWLSQRWQRGRKRAGLCSACGYDLRASPGRCPECGTIEAT
jgi:hypothetical protein